MITNKDLDFTQYKSKIYIGNQDFLSKEIVRYTSVENLRLILNGHLHLTIRKDFVDKREAGKFKNKGFIFRIEPVENKNKICWNHLDEKIAYSRNLPTSCWSQDTKEDVLMWKAYNASIRIKTSIKKVLDAINTDYVNMVFCNKIEYKSEQPLYNVTDAMFCKNKAYHNENEFRFYFDGVKDNYCTINAQGLIDNVMVSPFISREAKLLLEYVRNEFPNLNITESSIIE